MTMIVSSPAMVPRMSRWAAWSTALARNWAAPGGVRITTRLALDSAKTSRSRHSEASRAVVVASACSACRARSGPSEGTA